MSYASHVDTELKIWANWNNIPKYQMFLIAMYLPIFFILKHVADYIFLWFGVDMALSISSIK